jgi:hypothetical protein
MSRLGSSLDAIFCDKMKGKVDPNTEYTTDSLIDLVRDDLDFKFEDFVAWLFGGADWIGDATKEAMVISKINEFITNTPSPLAAKTGEDPMGAVISCTSDMCKNNFYMHYGFGTEAQQETYKQALCDLFHS